LFHKDVSHAELDPSLEERRGCSVGDNEDSPDDMEEWMYMERGPKFGPEVWDVTEEEVNADLNNENTLPHVNATENNASVIQCKVQAMVRWIIIFFYLWAYHCAVSETAIELLLSFFVAMFDVLGNIFSPLVIFTCSFPKSYHGLKKYLGLETDNFVKYVVCTRCNSVYNFEECHTKINGKTVSKNCLYAALPHHRQVHRRATCNEPLLKEVILKNGQVRLYPKKVYCYNSVVGTLRRFLRRPDFALKCELWRKRDVPRNFLADIFDGNVWKDWQYVEGQPFLASPNNFAFMLNVDWFQPYEHSIYSVGALYMVVMNLPRAERFKPENVLLVGLIPGPNEPKMNINSFLKPLVGELKVLWKEGIRVDDRKGNKIVRAALLCVACDIPATRKVCGFTGHSSSHGCSKCTKVFQGSVGNMNFSGFDDCSLRTNEQHRQQAQHILNQTSAADKTNLEKLYGTRYSELMELPYFNCIRYHIIDPMHNLFLGTAKQIMKNVWIDSQNPLISKNDLEKIQAKMDDIKAPSTIGRMPRKIANSYGGFTADQWKTWTILFSIFCLWDVLPKEHLEVWRNFVMSCVLFCTPVITEGKARLAHTYIIQFCKGFQQLYGPEKVTPNMHLHTHLLDCILDYGPVYSFWLFSFERYNGLLGDYITNQRSPEIQLMRKFVGDQLVKDLPLPKLFEVNFKPMFEKLMSKNSGTLLASLQDCQSKIILEISLLAIGPIRKDNNGWKILAQDSPYECCCPIALECLEADELTLLKGTYAAIFNGVNDASVTPHFEMISSVRFAGELYGSLNSRSERSCFVMARWCTLDGNIDTSGRDLRPGIVLYYLRQNIEIKENRATCILAAVKWFSKHPQREKLGAPAEVWCRNQFEMEGSASFIPIQRILCKFVPAYEVIDREQVLVVCPIPQKVHC
jgi:hypothetical protein